MPERKMGAAVAQNCDLLEEVCDWVNAKATVPVWEKMTPNITDISTAEWHLNQDVKGLQLLTQFKVSWRSTSLLYALSLV